MTKDQVDQMDSDELFATLKMVSSRLKEDGFSTKAIIVTVINEIEGDE